MQCKICGSEGVSHGGTLDCLNYYRWWIEKLYQQIEAEKALHPKGKEVLRASLSREATAFLWIEGTITDTALERLMKFVGFMREAWVEEEGELEASQAQQHT
jgi:hypothetical protein